MSTTTRSPSSTSDIPKFNRKRALRLVTEMMAIPGPSGEERAVAEYITKQLTSAGLPADRIQFDTAHRRSRIGGQIGNMIVRLPGTVRGERFMMSAHLDTVPVCVGSVPVRRGAFIRSRNPQTGLGADNRAGSAILLVTLLELLEQSLPYPPLTFCWFVQEEIGLEGSRHVTKSLLGKPAYAVNWDGGSPYKVTIGATGGYRMKIAVEGVASHAGVAPEKGVSAITIASLAIADLHREGWLGLVEKNGERGTSNIGVIQGGAATNVVTDRVDLRAEARGHNPVFRQQIIDAIEEAFTRAASEVRSVEGAAGRATFEGRLDYESFLIDPNSPLVASIESAIRAVGQEPVRAVSNGGLDANWLTRHGVPTVSLGAGQVNAHMTSEALDIAQYEDACRIALRIVRNHVA